MRGKLRLVASPTPRRCRRTAPAISPRAERRLADPDTQSTIVQGAIEKSNVSAVLEMTRMIEVTRSYTQMAAMLAQQTDLQSTAIDKLAAVPN